MGAVAGKRGTESVEHLDGRATRIGVFLDHHGRYRVDQHGFGHPSWFRSRHIMCDLAAASRVADMDHVLEIECRDQFGDIGRIGVHFVPAVGLVRPPMAPAVVGDHAISFRQEKHHLIVPIIGTQWPAMVEQDRLSASVAPVLVEDLGGIFVVM